MADTGNRDSTEPRVDGRSRHGGGVPESARLEVLSDADSDTVTFVSRRPEDDRTTTWVTVDADLLVDVAEVQ